ncbi:MAG TPA: radical SAM protein, partial [Elusimicrobiales bacterium]|nr:radical SAM protein [Elusimicrobiales bacterium]
APREIPDLDQLPLPDFSGFPMGRYLLQHTLPVAFNRGCLHRCSFCGVEYYWKKFRTRSADSIYAEFRRNMEVYSARHFEIDCPAFNLDLRAVDGLCDRMLADGMKATWSGMGLLSPELCRSAEKIARAGCARIDFGFESGSDRVLALMRKPFNSKTAESALRACSDAGIKCSLSIIIGFPGETDEDVELTKRFLERNRVYISDIGHPCECGIGGYSPMQQSPQAFGIKPESIRASLAWESADGKLTHAARAKRLKKFNEWLREAGFVAQNEPSQGLIADQPCHLT